MITPQSNTISMNDGSQQASVGDMGLKDKCKCYMTHSKQPLAALASVYTDACDRKHSINRFMSTFEQP